MRAEWHSSVRRVAVHADRSGSRSLGSVTSGRIAGQRQRVRISGGLEEISSEHGVGDGPGEGHALAFVLHASVLEPDFDGRLL